MPYKDSELQKKYQREWMRERRARFLKGYVCVDCGSKENIHIDHVDPKQKSCHRIWSWSEKRIKEELSKCVPRCEKCHTEKHAKEKRVKHHGITMYENHGCRCETCKKAKAQKNLEYRNKKKNTRSRSRTGDALAL